MYVSLAATVVNAGAGTGSYEPDDRRVVGLEPSLTMIEQRPVGCGPIVQGVAEHLPFADRTVDEATIDLGHRLGVVG